jgi:hypothetical protein
MADQAIYQRQTGWQEGYEARYRSHNRAQVAVTVAVAVPLFVIPPIKNQVISIEAAHAFCEQRSGEIPVSRFCPIHP